MKKLDTKKTDDVNTISNTLKTSLESTVHGLQMFVESLEKSGMKKSISEYKKLQVILIQQRLWSEQHNPDAFQPLWNEIANKASQIDDVLNPFSEIMKEIRYINTVNSRGSKTFSSIFTDEEKMMLTILSTPRYLNLDKLSFAMNLDKKRTNEIIDRLLEKKIVEKKGSGKIFQIKLRDELLIIDNNKAQSGIRTI